MNWLYVLWYGYFWPSLKGNGPEALVQTVVYGLLAYLFLPPVKAYIDAHVDSIHAKLNHVIKHSKDIPPMSGHDSLEKKGW